MTEAVLEKETECKDGSCTVELGSEELRIEKSIVLFEQAVKGCEQITLLGTANPTKKEGSVCDPAQDDTVFVIRNHALAEGIEGAYVEVGVREVIEKVDTLEDAMQFVNTVTGKRAPVVVQGVTRIVGYYSRVHNWNKSKVGELRDRAKGEYWTNRYQDDRQSDFQPERMGTIDNL